MKGRSPDLMFVTYGKAASRILASLPAYIVILTAGCFGQTLAEITGEVRDPGGAPIKGAIVSATDQATGIVRSVVSNDAGFYRFSAIQPGIYDLKVATDGFHSIIRKSFGVHVQEVAHADFQLELGPVQEVVQVVAGSAALNTDNATLGVVIDNRTIVELPLNGRNYLQLAALSPNVSFGFPNSHLTGSITRQGGTRAEQHISIAGQRDAFNRFTLDGIENTDVNFNTYVILPSIDALQEFKVQHGVYPAEFGRQPGQINVSTKSGTNRFHGTLFEFLRNDKLDAKAYAFTTVRPPKDPFKWNQFGFTLTGPVYVPGLILGRNRLFFMSNFEGYRDRKQLRGVYNVPSIAMRDGDFSQLLPATTIYDPRTRARQANGAITAQPFARNIVPKNMLDPLSTQLLEFYPLPNVPGASLTSNYQIGQNREIDKDQFTQRIDAVESDSSMWYGRFSWGQEQQINPAMKLNGSKLLTTVRQAMVSNTRTFSPTIVSEFRLGYNQFFNSIGHELAFERDVVSELKIPGIQPMPAVAWGIPEIRMGGLGYFGNLAEGPYVNDNNVLQVAGNISTTLGSHSLRAGSEVRWDAYDPMGNSGVQGRFAFDGIATQNPASRPGTGYGFADYMLGEISSSQGALALAVGRFRSTSYALYADDTWRLLPHLTLSLGLRYENTPPWLDQSGTLINAHLPVVDFSANVQDLDRHPTLVRIGRGDFYEGTDLRFNPAIKVARDGRLGSRLVARDGNDFAPRIGISWSPRSAWTLRAGAGFFYSQDTGNPRFDMSRNIAGRRTDLVNPEFPDLNWKTPFRGLGGTLTVSNPFVLANVHQRRTPYVMQYLLNIQRQISANTVLELGYTGSTSRKLEALRLFNQPLPSPVGSAQSRSPYPELGLIQMVDSTGKARYDSLMLRLQRRFASGLTYLLSYTWSKSIDTGSAIRVHNTEYLFPQNNYCIDCERGVSSFHVGQRWITSALYELPFGRGRLNLQNGLARYIAGEWQLGSIVTLQTGLPLTAVLASQRSNTTGVLSDRPDATGRHAALPSGEQDPERFFNTGAFALQPFGSFGTAGRNQVIGPGLINWDFSAIKSVRIHESHRLQIRFEAFNLSNHPNWDTPAFAADRVDFGKVRATRIPMRELQFALKYIF